VSSGLNVFLMVQTCQKTWMTKVNIPSPLG